MFAQDMYVVCGPTQCKGAHFCRVHLAQSVYPGAIRATGAYHKFQFLHLGSRSVGIVLALQLQSSELLGYSGKVRSSAARIWGIG